MREKWVLSPLNGLLKPRHDHVLMGEVGLLSDDQLSHSDRLAFWRNFNFTWLTLFQQHIDILSFSETRTGLLEAEELDRIGKELIKICDRFEEHGLVDYKMGIWEEEILDSKEYLNYSAAPFLTLN